MKITVINKYILLYNSIYSTRFNVIMWHEILYFLQNLLIPLFLLFANKADAAPMLWFIDSKTTRLLNSLHRGREVHLD